MDNKLSGDVFWASVVREVRDRKRKGCNKIGSGVASCGESITRQYFLHNYLGEISFSEQEVAIILGVMRGNEIEAIAKQLSLSPHTISFYFNNMKRKLRVVGRLGFIDEVVRSGFLFELDCGKTWK